ncbi:MAG: zinc-finger domain-containing protein [Alphaproteobacteria bacterium]
MAADGAGYPKFANDDGVAEIRIGVREFECVGARPPHDHPHVYLDMGDETTILCPYCGTRYTYDPSLGRLDCVPASCRYEDNGAVKAATV